MTAYPDSSKAIVEAKIKTEQQNGPMMAGWIAKAEAHGHIMRLSL
jgi:hypothetical protein